MKIAIPSIPIAALAFLVLPNLGFGDQWPDEPEGISGLFGRPISGSFGRGVDFTGSGQRVTAWGEGEVIWTSQSRNTSTMPGNPMVVLQHQGGFRSAYRGVDPRPNLDIAVRDGDWLGYTHADTWTFEISDSMQSRIIDPITLLPAREPGIRAGTISAAFSRIGAERSLQDGMILESGRWNVVVGGVVPKEIALFWLGQNVAALRLATLAEVEGRVVAETPDPAVYEEVYDEAGRIFFPRILFNPGRGTLELRVRDHTGQTTSKTWNLVVRG